MLSPQQPRESPEAPAPKGEEPPREEPGAAPNPVGLPREEEA